VNSVRNNDESLIQPDEGEEEKELTLF
jgi:hypothetical protein